MNVKRCFTLFEMLLVIFLLSIGAAAVGVKLKDYYKEQKFYSEVDLVLGHLKLAQDLMIILDHDVYVNFFEDHHQHLTFALEVVKPLTIDDPQKTSAFDASLSNKWRNIVEKKIELKAIRRIEFTGDTIEVPPTPEENSVKKLRLRFSYGSMHQGLLELKDTVSDTKDQLSQSIFLPGFPSPLKIHKEKTSKPENIMEESKRLFPKID